MRVLFIFPRDKAYDSTTVRTQPCGGTEKSAIFLSEALRKKGVDVCFASTHDILHSFMGQHFDYVVCQDPMELAKFPSAKRIWMLHQFPDTPYTQSRLPSARMFADQTITLSQCQQQEFESGHGIVSTLIPHGIWHQDLAPEVLKKPFSMIYASTPNRGLELLPGMFREIRQFQPEATLTICSSFKTYGWDDQDTHFQALFDELRQIEGVTFTGSLNQGELYQLMAQTRLFLYPCTYRETYCIVMDEAMAHGCIPVITDLAAIAERFPASGTQPQELIQMVRFLFENPQLRLDNFNHVQRPISWDEVAKQWLEKVLTRSVV